MKKNRVSKIFITLIAITMTFICASCSHDAAVNDCFLSVSATDASRSVLPYFDLNDMTFILKGKLNGGEEQTLVIYNSYQAMVKDKLAIEKGSWEFTLYASTDTEYRYDSQTPAGTVLSGTASKEIKKGLNSISFALVLQERDPIAYPSQKNGIVDIQIKLPEAYDVYVKATVPPINGTISEEYTLQTVNHSAEFKKDDFSNGFYNITFDFYKDADCLVKIFSHQETVETLEGCTSKATLDFEKLNPEMHAITYNLNGGSYASGYKAPASYESVWGTTLPNALQVTKSGGYVLAGWYDNPNFTGKRYDVMRGLESNMILYAKWVPGIVVTKETVSSLDLSKYTEPVTIVYVGELDDTLKKKIQESPVSINLILSDIGTVIGNDAFEKCSNLTSVTIPEGVTSIGNQAFYNCSSLTSITIPEGVTSIGDDAFSGCSSLTSVDIPEDVTSIGRSAFRDCSNLTSVTIPEGVTSIGEYAFSSCSSLTSVNLPSSLKSIDGWAFHNCSKINELHIHDLQSYLSIDMSAIGHPFYSSNYTHKVFVGNQEITNLVIPDGVTSICDYAFHKCSSLTSITLPSTLKTIGNYAFSQCPLTSISIPNGVTEIGEYAFSSCSNLESVSLPSTLTSIGRSAFYGCNNLTSITLPASLKSLGNWAFYGCSKIESITIPNGVTTIGEHTFYSCKALSSVNLPSTLTSIGEEAFSWCEKLTSIKLPSTLKTIATSAFYKCSALTSVTVPSGCNVASDAFPSGVTITRN